MAAPFAYIYSDPRWKSVRPLVLDSDDHTCVNCGATDDLTIDHMIPLNKMTIEQLQSDLPFDANYLRTYCRRCNGKRQDREDIRTTWRSPKWKTKSK